MIFSLARLYRRKAVFFPSGQPPMMGGGSSIVQFNFCIFPENAAMALAVVTVFCLAHIAVSGALPTIGMDAICNRLEDREIIWIRYLYVAPLTIHNVQVFRDHVLAAELFDPIVHKDMHFCVCPDLEVGVRNGKLSHSL